MQDMTAWGAAQLVKESAAQILWRRTNRVDKEVTPNMEEGVQHQETMTGDNPFVEMRGTFNHGDNTIFFVVDELCPKVCAIEHKSLLYDDVKDWYIQSSQVQAAFYKSLIALGSTTFETANFALKQGKPLLKQKVSRKIPYFLVMGEYKLVYGIEPQKPKDIVQFYLKKIDAIRGGWDTAKAFDKQFKHKEFDTLKEFFTIDTLEPGTNLKTPT